jgi:hypothetical protein
MSLPPNGSPVQRCRTDAAKQLYAGEHVCQSIGGVRLENTVLDELFTVLEPAALTATAQALAEADTHHRRDLAVFELATERARYEADRALCADEAVREAITTVFRCFDELGSARQVLIRLREDGVLLPRRRNGAKRILWAQPTYPGITTSGSIPMTTRCTRG